MEEWGSGRGMDLLESLGKGPGTVNSVGDWGKGPGTANSAGEWERELGTANSAGV